MPKGRTRSEHPHPVDVHVGGRLRMRRTYLGMSQEKLGEALGITFQQVQKYERGANRMSASRLYELSRALGIPIQYFFDGLDDTSQAGSGPGLSEASTAGFEGEKNAGREILELVNLYKRIDDGTLRRRLSAFVKAIVDSLYRT